MATPLGEKMRRLRKEQGLTLEGLARAVDSSKSYIWELENKAPPRPSAEKLARIATTLGVTIDYLLDQSGEIQEEEAVDAEFYRKYKEMDPDVKERIRRMIEIWEDK